MPGNSCGPGRARGRNGTTTGTAPRPEGCSRARRRRTGACRTGRGGRGTCACQRRAASTRATLLPPLGMAPSVMPARPIACPVVADSGCPLWPPMATADSSDTGFLRNATKPPAPGAASRGFAARALVTPCHVAHGCGRSGVTHVRRGRARIPQPAAGQPWNPGCAVTLDKPAAEEYAIARPISGGRRHVAFAAVAGRRRRGKL
jgi:hypothetical protein